MMVTTTPNLREQYERAQAKLDACRIEVEQSHRALDAAKERRDAAQDAVARMADMSGLAVEYTALLVGSGKDISILVTNDESVIDALRRSDGGMVHIGVWRVCPHHDKPTYGYYAEQLIDDPQHTRASAHGWSERQAVEKAARMFLGIRL